jgi:photosystem II stability/assembly factor-like uncharacterized protein
LQAVSAVDERTVWVSGVAGTYARTVDGGATWVAGVVPGADSLQFRDVHAVSADTVYLLSAGTGEASRIYKTSDGGSTWTLQFTNTIPTAFFDCFAFWDATAGLAFSDAVDGAFVIRRTDDGEHWEPVPEGALPPALEGEGGFAASGTCVITADDSTAWIGMGNAERARVLRTDDRGTSWTVTDAPVVAGTAAGITTVAFRSGADGLVAGGAIADAEATGVRVARTADGGRSWAPAGDPSFSGAVYGAAYARAAGADALVTVGPGGASYSRDDGSTWLALDTLSYWGLGFADGVGWLAGPEGRIVRLRFR